MTLSDQDIVIVTGLSGAGMSSVLKSLEDIGYEVLDNLPLSLVDPLLESSEITKKPIAIGIDTRTREFNPDYVAAKVKSIQANLVFVTCDERVLQQRFTETRRRHPLAKDRPVSAGIQHEKQILKNLHDQADFVIDTTSLSIHDLRRIVENQFSLDNQHQLTVTLMSFGFKNGVPREADIVMDVRFLKNPHWVDSLKSLTGRDQSVAAYIEEDDAFGPFIDQFKTLIDPLLPRYSHEGKSYLTIAIGCTGGRHRSVYTVEKLYDLFKNNALKMHILHRDLTR